ncbi:MAG: LamG domain-containing protein [Candidatus Saccharimonadales bacterium]
MDSAEKGLVGYWPLNGNAKDSTPYADNGTINGATLTDDRKGTPNSAYSFNGTSNYIDLGNPSTAQLNTGSLSIWFKTADAGSNYRAVFDKTEVYSIFLYNNQLSIYDWSSSALRDSGINLPDNQWHNVVETFQSGVNNGTKLYVDGQLVYTTSYTTVIQGYPLTIGQNSSAQQFAGTMDDARLYNRILSPSEIKNLYNDYNSQIKLHPPRDFSVGRGLVAYPFNGNAKDATPYANNGTVNGATLTTDRKGQADSAYSFNGSSDDITTPKPVTLGSNSSISLWFKTTYGYS